MRKNLPDKDLFLGKKVPRFPDHTIEEYVSSGFNGHLFRAHSEVISGDLAFKIVPKSNIRHVNYIDEAKKANILQHASVIRCIDVVDWTVSGLKFVVFVYDYIKGPNLKDYVKKNREDISIPLVVTFLESIFGLLHEMKLRNMFHGDLHAGNILVSESEYDLTQRTIFRVTDFGVGRLTGSGSHTNDFLCVAELLQLLLGHIVYKDCGSKDRYYFRVLRRDFLERHLAETNSLADEYALNPQKMFEKLNSLEAHYRDQVREQTRGSMLTPFDYPNCEQIGNHNLLLQALYSTRLLGLTEIRSRANLVLTGPRGCGKTTVFRALSLEYLISINRDEPEDISFVGIYYRCDDLYFSFPRYATPERTEAINIPMHFVVVTLLARLFEQIADWAYRHFRDEFVDAEERLVSSIWETTGWKPPNNPNRNQIVTLIRRLKGRERKRALRKHRFSHVTQEPIEGYFGPEIMLKICQTLRRNLVFLRDRPIYFFVDDYSHPKITLDLQDNLNRLLMVRSADIFFKLSTESPISFSRRDSDGKSFVESREYDMLNLGLKYLTVAASRREKFIFDIFGRRFKVCPNYPVNSLSELLGSSPRNENEVANAIRDGDRKSTHNSGCETIAAMCSGDIHYIIRLVSQMVEECGGADELAANTQVPKISPRNQHNSIRAAAGAFMESVRKLPRWGPQLADVITAFGNVAHSYLKFETSGNQTGNPPHQASRIEPYESLNLSEKANSILYELLRYSIIIEDPRGKSRRGQIVPRFYLRRYLIPHLKLTFSLRDSVPLDNDALEMMLCEPDQFEKKFRIRSLDDAKRKRGINPDQGKLFR